MEFECECCRKRINIDLIKMKLALPPEWRIKEIKGRKFLLCDSCGINGSPWIKDMLKR